MPQQEVLPKFSWLCEGIFSLGVAAVADWRHSLLWRTSGAEEAVGGDPLTAFLFLS